MKKHWILVLHSHLPFVKHPDYDNFLEEWWLFEAINETYIPLLMAFNKLEYENIPFKMTVSITPTLLEMLNDKHLMNKYANQLDKLIELGEKELIRTRTNYNEFLLAKFYYERFKSIKEFFECYLKGDILGGYRYYQDRGNLEIITSAATHGFLPFIKHRELAELQIDVGKQIYKQYLNRNPNGLWIPECAYFKGLSRILNKHSLNFFFVESHAIKFDIAEYNNTYSFRRDKNSAKVVWSSKEGYPGDYNYRDFYRDLGYDMPLYYIKDYLPGGIRTFSGYKYYRITGNTDNKELYDPSIAMQKSKEHAYNFHFNLNENLKYKQNQKNNLITSFYDAELFGHWWFEGIDFLYNLFKILHLYKEIEPTTPSEYIVNYPNQPTIEPKDSSWGDKGYYDVWLNGSNSWIYNHLHHAEDRLLSILKKHNNADKDIKEQLIRELLLAQSSDWAFLITAKDNKQYAQHRQKEHIQNFNKLDSMVKSNKIDKAFLEKIKIKNSVFSGVNLYETLYRLWRDIP